jgi:hypothetical protein
MQRSIIKATALLIFLFFPAAVMGQFHRTENAGEATAQQWRFGVIITAPVPCANLVGNVAVPDNWPEQQVRVVGQDFSSGVEVDFETIDGTLRQMIVKAPRVDAGATIRAVVTYEIRRYVQHPPEKTDRFVLPESRQFSREIRAMLTPSPLIESSHAKIKTIAKEVGRDGATAWQRVEEIYDWVRERIPYEENVPLMGAVDTLEAGKGDCNGLTSLFIAICRAQGIPARTVRVPGHCYPEFFLVDERGQGHWFPCQASGTRAFGGMPDPRPILQKGDSILVRDPVSRRTVRQRFLPETLVCLPLGSGPSPRMEIICEKVE